MDKVNLKKSDFDKVREFLNADAINPKHYQKYSLEVFNMIVRLFGADAAISYCEINAFKYRMRMGYKVGNSLEQDFAKEQWYLNKKIELENLKEQA